MFKKFLILLILFLCVLSVMIKAESYVIEIADYPEEIIIENGWIKYFNVNVTNKGDMNLNNVSIYIDGEFPQWFEVQTNQTDFLRPNNNASFLVKLSIPSAAESKAYSFNLYAKSKEIVDSKTFTVRVFKSKSDEMIYQIQKLQIEVEDVKRNVSKVESLGKNVTNIRNVLIEAENYLDAAKSYVDNSEYEKATNLMISVENSVKEAEFDLTIAPANSLFTVSSSGFPIEWLLVPVIAIAILIFFVLRRGKKDKTAKTSPVVKIKEIVLEGKEIKNLENEIKEIENSRNLLEEEYKENLISKESHDELKAKYENRLNELRNEIERNKKIV